MYSRATVDGLLYDRDYLQLLSLYIHGLVRGSK